MIELVLKLLNKNRNYHKKNSKYCKMNNVIILYSMIRTFDYLPALLTLIWFVLVFADPFFSVPDELWASSRLDEWVLELVLLAAFSARPINIICWVMTSNGTIMVWPTMDAQQPPTKDFTLLLVIWFRSSVCRTLS